MTRPKPWSVANFEHERAHMTDWARKQLAPIIEDPTIRRGLIHAPVKCGKREMVEYMAVRDRVTPVVRAHAFISAFHRTADNSQREELKEHNLTVFSITRDDAVGEFLHWNIDQKLAGRQRVIHLDECDYGSGSRQKMRHVWDEIRDDPTCTVLMYSATPAEVLFSEEISQEADTDTSLVSTLVHEGVMRKYIPPAGYCGPARFLAEGLVFKAEPFIERAAEGGPFVLGAQGAQILAEMRAAHATTPSRNLLFVRLSYEELATGPRGKQKKAFYQFLQNINNIPQLMADDVIIHVDKDSFPIDDIPTALQDQINCRTVQWSNRKFWVGGFTTEHLHVIIMDQTSTRSTEWKCHDRTYAYHDYRNTVSFSTVSQAQERVNHYEQAYGGFQPIKVYGHKRSFELSAGLITFQQYLKYDWMKKKVDVRTAGSQTPMFRIRATEGTATHPDYPAPLTEREANAALEKLDCLAMISLAARVRGSTYQVPVYTTEFHPVADDSDTSFSAFKAAHLHSRPEWATLRFDNPFNESQKAPDGRYMGYLRGWTVFNYEEDITTDPGWGIGQGTRPRLTICYSNGTLGISIRYFTGTYRTENTLTAFRSMYKV